MPNPALASIVYEDPAAVEVQLQRIGMPLDLLRDAILQGDLDRRSSSPLGFDVTGEYSAGSRTLQTICERGAETQAGWHRDQHLRIQVAMNGEETIAIHPTSGDEFTGILGDRDPRNRSLKGPATVKALERAPRLGDDWGEPQAVTLYYLLVHASGLDLFAELSSPRTMANGAVTGWYERILLGLIQDNGDPVRRTVTPPAPTPAVPIDPVRRVG